MWHDAAEYIVQEWATAVAALHDATTHHPADERAASQAAADLLSGHGGFLYAPTAMARLINDAVEIGYVTALHDVREGKTDP